MNDLHSINVWALIGGVVGLVTGVAGVVLNYLNRDRYSARADEVDKSVVIFRNENAELREINQRQKTENEVLRAEASKMKDQVTDLKELNSKQPEFNKLMEVMSNNHREMMLKLTDITKKAMK